MEGAYTKIETMPEESTLMGFYSGATRHPSGATLEEILQWSDTALEEAHDVIQWLFPTATPSQAQPGSPVLSHADAQEFLESEELRKTQLKALDRFLSFYGLEPLDEGQVRRRPDFAERAGKWMKSHFGETPHNFLRITRMLNSLQLLGNHEVALRVQTAFLQLADDYADSIDSQTVHYWLSAVSLEGPDEIGPNGVVIRSMRFADEDDLPVRSASIEALLQISELEAIGAAQARIDAVAADLPSGTRFNLIPPDVLAEMLGVDLDDDCDEYAEIAERMSIEEFDLNTVAEYLEIYLGTERLQEIMENGDYDPDELKEGDRIEIEKNLTASTLGDFNGDHPWIKRWNATASDGKIVSFQVCQGDGGSLSGFSGPYQAARYEWNGNDDGFVVSDFMPF